MGRTRRGNRSQTAQQRRYVNHLVSREAHRDLRKAESIQVLTQAEIYDAVATKFGYVVNIQVITLFERAEVLSDGRAEGTLQQVEHIEREGTRSSIQAHR